MGYEEWNWLGERVRIRPLDESGQHINPVDEHVGKQGHLTDFVFFDGEQGVFDGFNTFEITLDDDTVLYGHECNWSPVGWMIIDGHAYDKVRQ